MTTDTIRFSKWQRINLAAAAFLFAVVFGFSIWIFFDTFGIFILYPLLILVMGAAVLATGVRAVNAFLFRIEFMESSFRVHSFSWKGKKVAEYPYSGVVRVKRGLSRGEVIVEPAGSIPLKLTPFVYEGKEKRLLAEFEKRLPPGKVEPGLGISLSRFKKYDKITYPLYIGMLAGVFIYTGQSAGMDLARPRHGWPDAVPWKLGTFYDALSVDKQGAVWFSTSDVDTDAVQIGRLSGKTLQRWDVPAGVFSEDDNSRGILSVTGDSKGHPVVFLRTAIISWTGTEWKRKPLSQDFYWSYGLSISGDSLQFIDYGDGAYHYWSCPFEGDGCESLPVPEALSDLSARPIAYRDSVMGPVLAAETSKGPIAFYRYAGGQWNPIAGPLDLLKPFLLAFTVSGDGTLWVTRELNVDTMRQGYSPGPLAFGHWDAAAGEWLWSATEAFPGSFQQGIDGMEVDPLGRIWIAGYYKTANVNIGETAAAYTIRGERADLAARYTDKNSNFQMRGGLVQGPDGRLWSCDSGLVSLDAGAEELPPPIPAWIADLDNNKFQWILIGTTLVLEAVYFSILGVLYLKQKKSAGPGGNP